MIRRVVISIVIVLMGALVALHLTAVGDSPALIPDSWTPWIIITKGCFAVIGVILLLWHMDREWSRLGELEKQLDRKLRYLTLLAYGVLQTGASTGQLTEGVELEWRHLGGLIVSALFVVTAACSLRWSLRQDRMDVRS